MHSVFFKGGLLTQGVVAFLFIVCLKVPGYYFDKRAGTLQDLVQSLYGTIYPCAQSLDTTMDTFKVKVESKKSLTGGKLI